MTGAGLVLNFHLHSAQVCICVCGPGWVQQVEGDLELEKGKEASGELKGACFCKGCSGYLNQSFNT